MCRWVEICQNKHKLDVQLSDTKWNVHSLIATTEIDCKIENNITKCALLM